MAYKLYWVISTRNIAISLDLELIHRVELTRLSINLVAKLQKNLSLTNFSKHQEVDQSLISKVKTKRNCLNRKVKNVKTNLLKLIGKIKDVKVKVEII